KRAYCLKTQPATGETYPKSDLFNKAGWFDNLNGVLIGRSAAPDVSDPTKHNYLDALKAAFENIAVPVLYDVDIGHIPPQISLVNGADATVFFAENGSWVTQQL
ncbi:hypothetical protein PAG77_25435, partial [Klebsiella pneumoniae]|nr:hypothetical protein [Klebsiella pneumoniae]